MAELLNENAKISGREAVGDREFDIDIMLEMKKQINKIPSNRITPEYIEIRNKINAYLKKYCNHTIICDMIDITPDRSQMIQYCSICESTF
jgi:hypothetical protein